MLSCQYVGGPMDGLHVRLPHFNDGECVIVAVDQALPRITRLWRTQPHTVKHRYRIQRLRGIPGLAALLYVGKD